MDMSYFLKNFNMRNIYKIINIALIFTLIGIFLEQDIVYALSTSFNLRPPLTTWKNGTQNSATYLTLGNEAEKQIHKERLNRALERKYKAIALDIDRTIKKSSLPIDESILRKLIEYVRSGGILILATSRDPDSINRVFFDRLKEIGVDLSEDLCRRIFICGDNGSNVFNYLEFTQKAKKIVDSALGFEPNALQDKLCNNPLKPFLDEGLLTIDDIKITQNKVEIQLTGKKSKNSDKIAQSLRRYFSEQKISLRTIKSKYRIDINDANSSKMLGVEAIAEFLGVRTTEIAKIGDELNAGGNDSSFDDQASFSVREHNPKSQYQISVKLAKDIEGPEATSWLIDNLSFDFVKDEDFGVIIGQNEPNIETINEKLLAYFQKPFNERTESDRAFLLSAIGIKDPAAFIEGEATRHKKKNDRAKTDEDKQLVYEIVRSSGIDYLLDPHNPDLRIAYRHKKGASRPNSKYAIPHAPKHVLAALFKIKFKYSGLERVILAFLGLSGGDFLNTGGEIVSFNVFAPYPGCEIFDSFCANIKKQDYPLLMNTSLYLSTMPDKFRFASHSVDILDWVQKASKRYNPVLPNIYVYFKPVYLDNILHSHRKLGYLKQVFSLFNEFINQKF